MNIKTYKTLRRTPPEKRNFPGIGKLLLRLIRLYYLLETTGLRPNVLYVLIRLGEVLETTGLRPNVLNVLIRLKKERKS